VLYVPCDHSPDPACDRSADSNRPYWIPGEQSVFVDRPTFTNCGFSYAYTGPPTATFTKGTLVTLPGHDNQYNKVFTGSRAPDGGLLLGGTDDAFGLPWIARLDASFGLVAMGEVSSGSTAGGPFVTYIRGVV